METTKKEKAFEALNMMSVIRQKISSETQNMCFEELKAYVKRQPAGSKTWLIGKS